MLCHLSLQIQPRRHYLKLPLQANFYPMPSQAYIQDSHHRLTLHTAQSLGISSLESGLCLITFYLMFCQFVHLVFLSLEVNFEMFIFVYCLLNGSTHLRLQSSFHSALILLSLFCA